LECSECSSPPLKLPVIHVTAPFSTNFRLMLVK
jgi:hypothetical protein